MKKMIDHKNLQIYNDKKQKLEVRNISCKLCGAINYGKFIYIKNDLLNYNNFDDNCSTNIRYSISFSLKPFDSINNKNCYSEKIELIEEYYCKGCGKEDTIKKSFDIKSYLIQKKFIPDYETNSNDSSSNLFNLNYNEKEKEESKSEESKDDNNLLDLDVKINFDTCCHDKSFDSESCDSSDSDSSLNDKFTYTIIS